MLSSPYRLLLAACAALFVFGGGVPLEGKTMTCYVSTRGNDQWSGLLPDPAPDGTDGPFRSLERARDAVRAAGRSERRQVVLRGGTYYLDRPFELGPADSGAEGNPVVYRAQAGETVILSGGKRLTGWQPRGDGVWAAPVPVPAAGTWEFRQLRVGETRAVLARHPNLDPADPIKRGWLFARQAEDDGDAKGREKPAVGAARKGKRDELVFGEGDIPDGDVGGGQILLFPAWGWVGGPVQIGGIDRQRRVLKLTGANARHEVRAGNRYYLQNVRFALDVPGEFYLDRAAGELLYIPRDPDFADRGVIAPYLDRIVDIAGDAGGQRQAEHIRFEGIAFRDTRYSIAVDSLYTPDDTAIDIRRARHITIDRCTFSHLGGYAVRLAERASHCDVLRCTMRDMGQGGVITLGDSATQPTDCTIAGCRMQNLGQVYKHVAGVYVTTGSRIRVAHNTIHDVPRYAISFKSYSTDAASHHCIAEYNDIRRTNLETNDTGAIETLGRDRKPSGNIIRYNLILDTVGMKHTPEGGLVTPYYTWGIYLDDYSSGTLVYGNIVARNVRGGYHNHLGFDNVVENNIFVDGASYQAEWNGRAEMRRNTFSRNIVVYSNPDAVYLRAGGWDPAVLKECDHNVIWWTRGDLATTERAVTPAGTWSDWRGLGFDTHSRIADPLFVDPGKDDYRLRPESPALVLGFEPIPVEKIGADAFPNPDR